MGNEVIGGKKTEAVRTVTGTPASAVTDHHPT
jgi:hypothetical protein